MTDYNELLRVWATGFYQASLSPRHVSKERRISFKTESNNYKIFASDTVLQSSFVT